MYTCMYVLLCIFYIAIEQLFDRAPIADIDIVISGGGLKGYFMVGSTYILAKEMKKRRLRVARIAGTSAGRTTYDRS